MGESDAEYGRRMAAWIKDHPPPPIPFAGPNRTCLECMVSPVKNEGEVCSYECYEAWISWHLDLNGGMIILEDHEVIMLPLELHGFYKHTWRNRGEGRSDHAQRAEESG